MCELPNTPFETISDTANRLNGLYATHQFLDTEERLVLIGRLAHLMDDRLNEADATDHSRLAWLYLQLHDKDRALQLTEAGLTLDKSNEYCQKLKAKLG